MQTYVHLVDLGKLLKNEYLVAKIGVDTAENEPRKGLKNGYSKGPRWLYILLVGGKDDKLCFDC